VREELRAQLDETYGLEIQRIKDHLTERHKEEIDRLTRVLTRTAEEARRSSTQVTRLYVTPPSRSTSPFRYSKTYHETKRYNRLQIVVHRTYHLSRYCNWHLHR